MNKLFILLILSGTAKQSICQLPATYGQQPTTQYIEGARLVIDILQLFKKNKPESAMSQKPYKGNFCNFCLFNSDSTQKIKITLFARNLPGADTITMVIQPHNKECSLQIKCGVYNCKVEALDERVISWGDIFINEKEVQVTK
jgi:hypothetical protein